MAYYFYVHPSLTDEKIKSLTPEQLEQRMVHLEKSRDKYGRQRLIFFGRDWLCPQDEKRIIAELAKLYALAPPEICAKVKEELKQWNAERIEKSIQFAEERLDRERDERQTIAEYRKKVAAGIAVSEQHATWCENTEWSFVEGDTWDKLCRLQKLRAEMAANTTSQ